MVSIKDVFLSATFVDQVIGIVFRETTPEQLV